MTVRGHSAPMQVHSGMPPPPPVSLKDEERAIQRAARTVRSRRNSLLPVFRLPAEITTHIFAQRAASERAEKERGTDPGGAHRLGWVRVTHVCQRWRQIALRCPSLWSEMDFALGEKWVALTASRWQGLSPASIHVSQPLTTSDMRFIGANIPQTRFLRLHPPAGTKLHRLLHPMTHPAPLLETIDIVQPESDRTVVFPDNFLAKRAPRLRHFVVNGCVPVPWASPLLHNLVTLHVINRYGLSDPEARLDDILSVLERMPALESLELRQGLPYSDPSTVTPGRVVSLPRICHLCLEGRMGACTGLLRSLGVSPRAVVRTGLWCGGAEEQDFHAFLHAVKLFMTKHEPFTPSAPKISQRDDSKERHLLKVEAWRVSGSDMGGAEVGEGPPDLTLHFNFGIGWPAEIDDLDVWDDPAAVAWACHDALTSAHLRHLAVEDFAESWHHIASQSTGLRRIVTRRQTSVMLLRVLVSPYAREAAERGDHIFPALTSLVFTDVTRGPWGSVLVPWLEAREKAGIPLKELVLVGCDVTPPVIDPLAQMTPGLTLRVTGDPPRAEGRRQQHTGAFPSELLVLP